MRLALPFAAGLVALVATFALAPTAFADDGGWRSPDTLSGLVGSYTRPPLGGGPIAFVTLRGTDGYRAQGPYTRFVDAGRGQIAIESGTYSAIGTNPAIGAFILFTDETGQPRDTFFILGVRRDPLGLEIVALELADPADGSRFTLVRVGP